MNSKAAFTRSRQAGVTMIELLVTMVLAGILLGMGVSSYRYVTRSNRSSGEINALLGDMQFARYEAVKEGLSVQVCPAASTTAVVCDSSTNWSEGWIVLSNALSGTTGTANVLRRQPPFLSFNSTDTLTSLAANEIITFNREGFATGIGAGAAVFTLHDSTNTSSYTRCLMIGQSGVLQTAQSGQTYFTQTCT